MTYSYTTSTLVEAELRSSAVFSSTTTPTLTKVSTWISEESENINLRTGNVFGSTVVTSTYIDYDGDEYLRFPNNSLISIEKVEYNKNSLGQAESWVDLEEGYDKNFISYLEQGEIQFFAGVNASYKSLPIEGKKRFRLSYTHGYSTTPLEVQRLATLLVAKRVIMSQVNAQANTEGGPVQIGVIQIGDPSMYSINYLKHMNSEIDRLYSEIGQKIKTFRITRTW